MANKMAMFVMRPADDGRLEALVGGRLDQQLSVSHRGQGNFHSGDARHVGGHNQLALLLNTNRTICIAYSMDSGLRV
jgi:hypothetical protein